MDFKVVVLDVKGFVLRTISPPVSLSRTPMSMSMRDMVDAETMSICDMVDLTTTMSMQDMVDVTIIYTWVPCKRKRVSARE